MNYKDLVAALKVELVENGLYWAIKAKQVPEESPRCLACKETIDYFLDRILKLEKEIDHD